MRNLVCSCAAFAALVLLACGPSSKEVATAKTARYQGDKLQLFATVKATVEGKYKLSKSDETTLGLQTQPRWYSPEGLTTSASADDERDLPDKSIRLALVVTMLPDGDKWIVKVSALMQRKNAGMPKPDELSPEDPSVPGWATGKADQLAMDIHKALAQYEVKSPGGIAPAPAPGPAPDEPSQTAPSGSAAPPAAGSAGGSATP